MAKPKRLPCQPPRNKPARKLKLTELAFLLLQRSELPHAGVNVADLIEYITRNQLHSK
jgi:hypothetical protein